MNRRSFIASLSSLPFIGGINNGNLFAYGESGKLSTDKSIILIFLSGGISASDSFIVKDNIIPEYAPINGSIVGENGVLFGSDFPNMSRIKQLNTYYNYKTYDGNHSTATAYSLTGKPAFGLAEGASAKEPSNASLLSYIFGTNNVKNGLPSYVKLNRNIHDGSAWLGAKYTGFEATESGIKTLKINTTDEQFIRRNKIVNDMESINSRDSHYFKEWSNLRNQARDIVMGDAAKAFDLSKENPKWVTKYGADKPGFGKNCLLARRLVESGAKIVTLEHAGWDMHNNISMGMKERSKDLDLYVSVLTEDLMSKGLLDNTMIIITSEFSRTKMNSNAGRDHNPNITSLVTINNKNNGGFYGTCDSSTLVAGDNPFGPRDLSWSIMNWFGVPKDFTIVDNMARPRHLFQAEDRLIFN